MTYKGGMGILDRISRLVSSNVNAVIDKMSDPGKEIEQLIIEMEQQLRNARKEVQTALAQEKRQRARAEALAKSSREWEERAERAVRAGDDSLAKEALARKAQIDAEGQEATHGLAEAQGYAEKLTSSLKQLEQRIGEVKLRKETLKAKARASKGQNTPRLAGARRLRSAARQGRRRRRRGGARRGVGQAAPRGRRQHRGRAQARGHVEEQGSRRSSGRAQEQDGEGEPVMLTAP